PVCRPIFWRGEASCAHSRSCSRSPASPCTRTSPSARICRDARVPTRLALPRKSQARSASAISSTVQPQASPLRAASGWKSRARAPGPALLLRDEVLAGLTPAEIATMVPIIRGIAHSGVTILMTEHVMQAVMSLAEYVFVLAEGRIIAEGAPQVVVGNPRVVEAYLGHGAAARLSAPGGAHV